MFEGQIGKDMMIAQGYVPATCTLPVELAGPLIYSEVSAGRSACDGCNHNRWICKGKSKKGEPFPAHSERRLTPADMDFNLGEDRINVRIKRR